MEKKAKKASPPKPTDFKHFCEVDGQTQCHLLAVRHELGLSPFSNVKFLEELTVDREDWKEIVTIPEKNNAREDDDGYFFCRSHFRLRLGMSSFSIL